MRNQAWIAPTNVGVGQSLWPVRQCQHDGKAVTRVLSYLRVVNLFCYVGWLVRVVACSHGKHHGGDTGGSEWVVIAVRDNVGNQRYYLRPCHGGCLLDYFSPGGAGSGGLRSQ